MSYSTNLTDAQWALVEPVLNTRKATGRPPTVDRRAVLNALLSMDRTGCQWRMIPTDFPKRSTVRYYFDQWTADGTWVRVNDLLRKAVRTALERPEEPEKVVLDSQSVKTTEAGGDRGFDAGKKINGRKRHILVDTNGLLLRVLAHPADITESEGGEWMLLNHRDAFPRLTIVRVDQGYKDWFVAWAAYHYGLTVEVIAKPADQVGFVVAPKRWVVERTFAWLGRNRRLSKDYEKLEESSEGMVYLASIRFMLRRLDKARIK